MRVHPTIYSVLRDAGHCDEHFAYIVLLLLVIILPGKYNCSHFQMRNKKLGEVMVFFPDATIGRRLKQSAKSGLLHSKPGFSSICIFLQDKFDSKTLKLVLVEHLVYVHCDACEIQLNGNFKLLRAKSSEFSTLLRVYSLVWV